MNLAIIGFGNMGRALFAGALRAGTLHPADVVVAEPDAAKLAVAKEQGAAAFPTGQAAAGWLAARGGGQVLLAVKPQFLSDAGAELTAGNLPPGTVVTSILAGTPTAKVRVALGGDVRVVRAMPNLPAGIGHGATAICLGEGALPGDDSFAADLFRAVGPLVIPIPEDLMDAFTAIAGSGPAYLFYLAEAMERAAVGMGFSHDEAAIIVRQTLLGSSMLYQSSVESPGQLRAAVTSKGGTTAAAVGVLGACGAMDVWIRAMGAARDRGRELAQS